MPIDPIRGAVAKKFTSKGPVVKSTEKALVDKVNELTDQVNTNTALVEPNINIVEGTLTQTEIQNATTGSPIQIIPDSEIPTGRAVCFDCGVFEFRYGTSAFVGSTDLTFRSNNASGQSLSAISSVLNQTTDRNGVFGGPNDVVASAQSEESFGVGVILTHGAASALTGGDGCTFYYRVTYRIV